MELCLFAVRRDDLRPFEVEAGHSAVRAPGTALIVRLRDSEQAEVLNAADIAHEPAWTLGPLSGTTD
jgi:hypothetical protein